jgi:hypothetical protein
MSVEKSTVLAVRTLASGLTRIRCELERLKDMAETGKIDKKKFDESTARLGVARAGVIADITLETLSRYTCTPMDKLTEIIVKPLLFYEWYVKPKPLKKQVEERIKATDNVWDELTKLLEKPCERR